MAELKRPVRRALIEEGEIVDARVASIEEHSFQHDGKEVNRLKWAFTVTDKENEWYGMDIQGDTSTNFNPHPNCKPYQWTKALTGKAYGEGESLVTDQLVALPCRIIIEHKPGKDGTTWMRVRDVMPPGRASRAVTEAPAPNPF